MSNVIYLNKVYPEIPTTGNSFGKKRTSSHMHSGQLPTIKEFMLF